MSGIRNQRMIGTAEHLTAEYQYHGWWYWFLSPGPNQSLCAQNVEAVSVALDMANAAESDQRRGRAL